MSLNARVLALAIAASPFLVGCRGASSRPAFEAAGRNPAVVITSRGETHVVYVANDSKRLMHARLGDAAPNAVSPLGEAVDLRGENAPMLAERNDGALIAIYPVSRGEGPHHHTVSELHAQLSRDGGRTWSSPHRLDGDVAPRSHNFADFVVTRSGEGVLSWLDSRAGQQGVETAIVRSDLTAAPAQTADAKSCQCCRTALFAASNGQLWLAYRDLGEGNIRNIAYAVSAGADQPFAARGDVADDRWSIDGCPESGPRFAETPDGTIWLAWFNGASNAIELAAAARNAKFERHGVIAENANHPDLGTLPDGRLVAVYEAFRNGKRAIEARVSDAAHARWSAAALIAPEGSAPRYVRRENAARVSFMTMTGGTPHVRVLDPLAMLEALR